LAPARATNQTSLFTPETERDRGLARAIDQVRGKYGPKSILPGGITRHPPR
jgi:hypothetical protein